MAQNLVNARLAALGSALLFSTGGAAIKSTSLSSWQVAGLRSLIAACAVAIILPEARKGWSRGTALVGLAYALCLFSFVQATKNTTSANAIFLQGTAPLYLIFLGPRLLKEKARRSDWITLGLIAIGMVLVFWDAGGAQRLAPDPVFGNFCGAISGLTWALTVCGLRWLGNQSMAPVLIGNLIAFGLCLPKLFPLDAATGADLAALLYLGIVQVALAYWLLTWAVARLSALETSLLVMLEPALNPVWTWLVHGERPAPIAIAGGALIIGSTLIKSWLEREDVLI